VSPPPPAGSLGNLIPAVETFTCPVKVAVVPFIAVPDWLVNDPGLTGVYPSADTI